MSAGLLREAAALMRERANAVTSDATWTDTHYWVTDYDPSDPSGQTAMQRLIGGMDAPDCHHYSSWPPAVALAVADWLDEEVAKWQVTFRATQAPSEGVDCPPGVCYGDPQGAAANADHHANCALTIARAYLGTTP